MPTVSSMSTSGEATVTYAPTNVVIGDTTITSCDGQYETCDGQESLIGIRITHCNGSGYTLMSVDQFKRDAARRIAKLSAAPAQAE